MRLAEVIFTDSLPTLDLHGFDRMSAKVKINEFILDNIKMKQENVVIIHGVGDGIIRKTTHDTLNKNSHVLDYGLFYRNNGMTIVQLDIDK